MMINEKTLCQISDYEKILCQEMLMSPMCENPLCFVTVSQTCKNIRIVHGSPGGSGELL